MVDSSTEILVSGLGPEIGGLIVNFTDTFRPKHIGLYKLTATVDSRNNVSESNESNNVLSLNNIPVAVMGDVNGDGHVNILDAVVLSLAWSGKPSDPQWNIKTDLNHDGIINLLDGVRASVNWTQ